MKKTMRVRVTSADENNWYKDRIGEVFNVTFKNPKDENGIYSLCNNKVDFGGILVEHCEVVEDENGCVIVRELKDLIGLTGDNGFETNNICSVEFEDSEGEESYVKVHIGNQDGDLDKFELKVRDIDRLFYKLNNWKGIKCKYQPKAELEEITTIARLQEIVEKSNKQGKRFEIEYHKNKICVMETKQIDIGNYFQTSTYKLVNLEEYGYKLNIK